MRQGIVGVNVKDRLTVFVYTGRKVLRLYLLGKARATIKAEPLHLDTRKAFALLVYLALEEGEQQRDALAALLWPENDQTMALASLRQACYSLRRFIPDSVLQGNRQALWVRKDKLWTDAEEFKALASAAPEDLLSEAYGHPARLEQAASLYQGDFLEGFSLPDCPTFDDWQFFQAEAYRRQFKGLLAELVAWYESQRKFERAIDFCRRMYALEPHDEGVHRGLMKLYVLAGQDAAALRQYEACRKLLADDLGVEPDEETTRLYWAVKQKRGNALVVQVPWGSDEPAARPSSGERSREKDGVSVPIGRRLDNLPQQPTAFVGRTQDLEDLEALISNPTARLISIVAPGGMGKTRLALAVAEKQVAAGTFRDGVFFVPLAPVQAVEFLAQAVADALGLKLLGGETPEQQLLRQLSGRSMLLVLDNFEHLLSGRAFLSELVATAPDLKVLVTSRERTNVLEEWLYQLWGMAVPADAVAIAHDLRAFSAVELFERCARKANVHFDLGRHGKDVVRICRHLEGMPLGIELAASWVTTIPCKDIADEIERDLGFLESRAHGVVDRQRSLKTVFEYSWNRLNEAERTTLAKLCVFRGGFTRQAAEQVAGASLIILASLAEMALVRLEASGRYEIHELLRQFAEAKLKTKPDAYEATRWAHAQHFADMLARLEPDLKSARQFEALDEIAADSDNVLASWRWAMDHRDVATIGKLAMTFFLYCEMRGLAPLGSEVFQRALDGIQALEVMDDGTTVAYAKLLLGQSILKTRIGVFNHEQVQRSVVLFKPLAALDPASYICALNWHCTGLPYEGKHTEADALLDEADALARSSNDAFSVAYLLQTRGHNLYIAGRFRDAEPFFERSLAAFDACGDKKFKALALNNWSRTAIELGDYGRAAAFNAKGLAIRKKANDFLGIATSSMIRGRLKTRLGEYRLAKRYLDQAASLMQQSSNYQYWIMLELERGQLELALGNPDRAQQHFQSALQKHRADFINPYYGPKARNGLAHVHYLRKDHARARSLLEQSLEMSTEFGHLHSKAIALCHLGFVELAEENLESARAWFLQGLELCQLTGAAPLTADILVGWAELETTEGGLALLAQVERDDCASHRTREAAREKRHELGTHDSEKVVP